MMKKSLKKMVICFFMMVGIMGAVAVPTEAKSHVNYTKIYKKFAKKQVKKKKKNLYMAVVKLDTPVLLITDHVWDGTVNMAHLYLSCLLHFSLSLYRKNDVHHTPDIFYDN